jgi:hypothetical protein
MSVTDNIDQDVITPADIKRAKELLACKEGRLIIDISEDEALAFIEDMGDAHGSVENYYEYINNIE